MSSVVAICNIALSDLGKDRINSLSEASAEALACNQFYTHERDTLLQAYPWRFAGKTAALAQVTNTKPGAWDYAYKRPVDCLKVRWLRREYSADDTCPQTLQQEISNPYEIEGDLIFCNLSPAYLRYTYRHDDPSKYPPLFIDALAAKLAVRLAMPLTRDPDIRTTAYKFAVQAYNTAAAADANEVRESSDHDSDLVEARQ